MCVRPLLYLKDILLQEITYPVIRGLIQAWKAEELSNESMRNLFGIVRAVYNFHLDETAQQGTTTMLPWLIKWSKVEPAARVEVDAPCFTPEEMAVIVENGRGQFSVTIRGCGRCWSPGGRNVCVSG
jgi:hypothetical protein